MSELTKIDALEIGIKNSIEQRDYKKAYKRLGELKEAHKEQETANIEGVIQNINTLIETIEEYTRIISRPSREDYLHGAKQAVGVSKEEEIQELHRADVAPTESELEKQAAPYLQIIRNSGFMRVEDVCWIDGKPESESRSFNRNVEGTAIHLCGEHAVDYQVKWRPADPRAVIEPDVKRYAREKNPELFALLMTHSC